MFFNAEEEMDKVYHREPISKKAEIYLIAKGFAEKDPNGQLKLSQVQQERRELAANLTHFVRTNSKGKHGWKRGFHKESGWLLIRHLRNDIAFFTKPDTGNVYTAVLTPKDYLRRPLHIPQMKYRNRELWGCWKDNNGNKIWLSHDKAKETEGVSIGYTMDGKTVDVTKYEPCDTRDMS